MWPFRKLWAALHTAEQIHACGGGKEKLGWAAPITKTPVYVWEGSYSSAAQRVQLRSAREEDGNAGGEETPGLCRSSPNLLLCPKGILDTACSEQRWMLSLLEEVPLALCKAPEYRHLWGLCMGFEGGELWGGT